MSTLIAIGFTLSGVTGWFIHRAYTDALMLAQEAAHEKDKAFLWEEMHRLRKQVADLIGNE